MNIVIDIIRGEIDNPNSCFVFPSETASSGWARKICDFTGRRSVATGRFLAWDHFKESVIRADLQDKKPVYGVLRRLFAEKLIRKNAGQKFFAALIPPRFAEDGGIFTAQIASMLPSLALWEDRTRSGTDYIPDEEDRDFGILKKEYTEFLEAKNLFEPSWIKPPLGDRNHVYFIFFPEAIEDFAEYEFLLKNEKTIRLVHVQSGAPLPRLFFYDSARAEIRAAVLEILRLHHEGVPCEDIAVSVPDLEDMEGCLLRELRLYNIPARRRAGKPLADYGAGNIFSLIEACIANAFSFTSLKALLLDARLPWEQPGTNRDLIGFGVENNCVAGFRKDGRPVDVWEEALASADAGLGRYYRGLKRHLKAMTDSRSFQELRGRFQALFPVYLSREKSGTEATAVLTRCMEELASLIQVSEEYPDLTPDSPFGFYLAHLREKQYVPANKEGGVNIFPYRVAAASAFSAHFVLNVSQNAATVLYKPLGFLRQDKRARLGLADTDASQAFFRLYQPPEGESSSAGGRRAAGFLRISAAEKTFTGWAIPHSCFSGRTQPAAPAADDPFIAERLWWSQAGSVRSSPDGGAQFPPALFPVQKEGFGVWRAALAAADTRKFNFLRQPFSAGEEISRAVEDRIKEIQWDASLDAALDRKKRGGVHGAGKKYIRLSATDLGKFFTCPALWFFEKILSLSVFSLEAKLLDEVSMGNLYHKILERLFIRIRNEDSCFQSAHLEKYFSWARDYTQDETQHYCAFQGPLMRPLLVSQADTITRRLCGLLMLEAKEFDGYAVSDYTEKTLGFIQEDMIFAGKIDRVSISPEGEPVIIDYKSNVTPGKKSSTAEDSASALEDFQIAMYVRLYEEAARTPVGGAYFFSIQKQLILSVFDYSQKDSRGPREKYEQTVRLLDTNAREFAQAVRTLEFSPKSVPFKTCMACDYRTICRTTYSLNSRREDAL
ncbi:MAG: PD-(D/E)XK nuclease family protein [Spirochaetales bacterium]|jgi:RecB family exonuclease|nr:PD-(D/E)XK nuclease family protein [Spirochaetales bacterium]